MKNYGKRRQNGVVPPETLKACLQKLAMSSRTRSHRAGQAKTQMAILLFEASRTEAYLEWGVPSLAAFTKKLGLDRALDAKYRAAGKAFFLDQRELYEETLRALHDGVDPPLLPLVTALRVLPTAKKLGDQEAVEGLLQTRPKVNTTMHLLKRAARKVTMDEAIRLREFLEYIVEKEGKVCNEYESCTHQACASSYAAHAFASAALRGITLEAFLQEQAKIRAGLQGAIGTRCLACGTWMVQALSEDRDAPIRCPACFSEKIELEPIERTPNGYINNCALNYGATEGECQMCPQACPDKGKFQGFRATKEWIDPKDIKKKTMVTISNGKSTRTAVVDMGPEEALDWAISEIVGKKT